MNRKEAAELDRILRSFPGLQKYTRTAYEDTELCYTLGKLGMITISVAGPEYVDITITQKGDQHIAYGGFTKQVEDEEFDRNNKIDSITQAKRANKIAIVALLVASVALIVSIASSLFNTDANNSILEDTTPSEAMNIDSSHTQKEIKVDKRLLESTKKDSI